MKIEKSYFEEMELELTGTCNLKCPLCTRNYKHAAHMVKKNVRPLKDIIAQLDEFTGLKHMMVAGQVSEPTMYKEFLGYIEYLNSRGITYEIFTHGNTHNPAWWRKLGSIVHGTSMVKFTVCGSTQEIHEYYRIGANLQQTLDHAAAFRETNKDGNDWLQHIRFQYNADDLASGNMQPLVDQFSHAIFVETEGIRSQNQYTVPIPPGLQPTGLRDPIVKLLFKQRKEPGHPDAEIQCKSILEKKIYVNQFGQASACYTHAEFTGDYFDGNAYDYTDINAFKFRDCFICEKRTKTFIDKIGLDCVA
jgi:organic radical activating enzyme